MVHLLTNKDKREAFRSIAEEVLVAGDTPQLSYDLHWSDWSTTAIIDQYRFGVWMLAFAQHGNSISRDDLRKAEDAIASVVNEAVEWSTIPMVSSRDRLTTPSPVELVGRWAPRIGRRCDLTPRGTTVQALNAMSQFPFVLDRTVMKIALRYRDSLVGENEEHTKLLREAFMPQRLVDEWEIIGDGIFFCPWRFLDEQGRMYADTKGTVAPMFDKISRATTRGAEYFPISERHWRYWGEWCRREFNIPEGTTVDQWACALAEVDDPLVGLRSHGKDYMMDLGCAHAWTEARRTGRTNYLIGIDVPASGLGHIYTLLQHPSWRSMVDLGHPEYVYPYSSFAKALRNADAHRFHNGILDSIMVKLAKGTLNPGEYGGGINAIVSYITGVGNCDGEWLLSEGKLPQIPAPYLEDVAGLNGQDALDELLKLMLPLVETLREQHPSLRDLNKDTRERWKDGMKSVGLPNPIVVQGHSTQPTPFTRNRFGMQRILLDDEGNPVQETDPRSPRFGKPKLDPVRARWYTKPQGGKLRKNNYPCIHTGVAWEGTQGLAKEIHKRDAFVAAEGCVFCASRGINTVWIHDCLMANVTQVLDAQEGYVHGFNTCHDVDLPLNTQMMR